MLHAKLWSIDIFVFQNENRLNGNKCLKTSRQNIPSSPKILVQIYIFILVKPGLYAVFVNFKVVSCFPAL